MGNTLLSTNRGKFMCVPSFCRARVRAQGNAENTPGETLRPRLDPDLPPTSSHEHMWQEVSIQIPALPQYQCSYLKHPHSLEREEEEKKKYLFFPSKSADTIKRLNQGRAEVMLFFFSVFSHQRPQCSYHCQGEVSAARFPSLFRSNCWACLTLTFPGLTKLLPIKPGFKQTSTGSGYQFSKPHFCEEAVHKQIIWQLQEKCKTLKIPRHIRHPIS